MLVAIYVRISQENPDGYSLADQEQRCRAHAEAQGWTVVRVYVDDGVSGRRWDRPALQRMLVKDWIRGEWGRTDGNRRARYYRLTPAGRRQLDREIATYQRIAHAIARVLQPA